jgi:hypothetical protein
MDFRQVDRLPGDTLNHVLWPAMRGTRDPCPDRAITTRGGDDDD